MGETVCKTVRQYNKVPISTMDMEKLLEIAADYASVKNYVYARYGGIGSLAKIYPGYTVQNEMTGSGLRAELGLPSVYFYLAVFDALGDIKSQWTATKTKILKLIGKNDNLTADEKHFLRFILKTTNALEEVLNQKQIVLPKEFQRKYEELAAEVDVERMKRYLCRQVRKYMVKLHTDVADSFSIAERAYRYADHGIYISTKEKRQRIFVPLTDNNQYKSQLCIKLYPAENRFEIRAAVDVAVHSYSDYKYQVGVALGMYTMFTTHEGHCYGQELAKYQTEYADWVRTQTRVYCRNRADNPGRKKYNKKKNRFEERLHSYINHELNRFFQIEKPKTIYLVKMPKPYAGGSGRAINSKINYSVSMWQRGYIKDRLAQKCRERSVLLVEVLGKNISNECSECGAPGTKKDGVFFCGTCGYRVEEKINTARNVRNRGENGKIVRKSFSE